MADFFSRRPFWFNRPHRYVRSSFLLWESLFKHEPCSRSVVICFHVSRALNSVSGCVYKNKCITNDYYDFWLLAFAVWIWLGRFGFEKWGNRENGKKKITINKRTDEKTSNINYLNNTFVCLSKDTDRVAVVAII